MKTYTITKQNFLEWYFNTGADDEQESMRKDLGERVIESLINIGQSNIVIEEIFNECETSCIPLYLLEEFEKDEDYKEVGDLEGIFNIELI
jgi:hypothetical protein